MKDQEHMKVRDKIEAYLNKGYSIEEIAKTLFIPIGTRYIKGTAKWYKFCIIAKENQKKAIEKYPNLYSKAGRIAQQKNPWIGKELGKKYGKIAGKKRALQLKGNSEYFSKMSKRLQELNPEHSRNNMKKAHETMKRKGIFNDLQRLAALKCKEKNPNQLREMSKKAHELYPLALLAMESKRKNYPYEFMGCYFDSNEERIVCKKLVEEGLIKKPIEKSNIHYQIGRYHVDFFIKNKIFVEFHPPRKFGRKIETLKSYSTEKREILDRNGYKGYPLLVIDKIKNVEPKIKEIKDLLTLALD